MNEASKDIAASVKQRLLNLAKERHVDFNLLQVQYATERLLYRLSISPYANDFFLKGAVLFVLWENHSHRPTRDVDLLFLKPHDLDELDAIFRAVTATPVGPDGITFDANSIQTTQIREASNYGGIRIKMVGYIGNARVPIQVDIGLGDAVYPEPQWTQFTTLLDLPAPRIRPYPAETVVAEKLQALVELGMRNTRMKDFYDLLYLQQRFEFAGPVLQHAIQQTFLRRKTPLPSGIPDGLSADFANLKQRHWQAFLGKNQLGGEKDFASICRRIASFALPPMQNQPLHKTWLPEHGWSEAD